MLKKYFIRGLVFITPIGITALILISIFEWIVEQVHNVHLQGISLLLAFIGLLAGITLLGYFGSTILIKPFAKTAETFISKIPLVSFIYTSIKDLSNAFIGDKKKFDKPVLVSLDKQQILKKPGFITRSDLSSLSQKNFVAVYMPHSYNFSGNIFIVDVQHITPVEGIPSGEFMKFIVSGGVSGELNTTTNKD